MIYNRYLAYYIQYIIGWDVGMCVVYIHYVLLKKIFKLKESSRSFGKVHFLSFEV